MNATVQWICDGDSETILGCRVLLAQHGETAVIGQAMYASEPRLAMAGALEKAAAWLRSGEVNLRRTGGTVVART